MNDMHSSRAGSGFPWNRKFLRIRRSFAILVLGLLGVVASSISAAAQTSLDNELVFQAARDAAASHPTRAIVMLRLGAALPDEFTPYAIRRLRIINGYVVYVDNDGLDRLGCAG